MFLDYTRRNERLGDGDVCLGEIGVRGQRCLVGRTNQTLKASLGKGKTAEVGDALCVWTRVGAHAPQHPDLREGHLRSAGPAAANVSATSRDVPAQ